MSRNVAILLRTYLHVKYTLGIFDIMWVGRGVAPTAAYMITVTNVPYAYVDIYITPKLCSMLCIRTYRPAHVAYLLSTDVGM